MAGLAAGEREDGLAFHQRRFGNKAGLWILDHIVGLLEDPGTLPRDPVFEHMRGPVLQHLSARVPDLRDHLTDIRAGMAVDLPATPPSDRAEGGMLLDAESLVNPELASTSGPESPRNAHSMSGRVAFYKRTSALSPAAASKRRAATTSLR